MNDRSAALDRVHHLARELGLDIEDLVIDGEWHRCAVDGDKRNRENGTYCLSEFELRNGRFAIVGMLNNFKSGVSIPLTLDDIEDVTKEEMAEARRKMREATEQNKKAKLAKQEETATRAQGIWEKLPDSGKSKYLDDKKVMAWGIRFSRGSIVVPARDVDGKIWTLQFIDGDGGKRFLTGGAKRGRCHLMTRPPEEGRAAPSILGFAEGYATAATIFQALGDIDIAVTFDAGNILPVAQAFRAVYPDRRFVFFADNDIHKGYPQAFIRLSELTPAVQVQIDRLTTRRPDAQVEVVADSDPRLSDTEKHYNTGLTKAILAAAAVGGDVVLPYFNQVRPNAKEAD